MENNKITASELEQLFEEYPDLKKFSGRYRVIKSFIEDGATETDLTLVRDDYQTALRLQEQLFSELLTFYTLKHSENFNEVMKRFDDIKKQNEELVETINKDRTIHREIFDSTCVALLVNPVDGFQALLDHIEREQKKEDLSGKGWLWTFKFSLRARLHMAWKLIFNVKKEGYDNV